MYVTLYESGTKKSPCIAIKIHQPLDTGGRYGDGVNGLKIILGTTSKAFKFRYSKNFKPQSLQIFKNN